MNFDWFLPSHPRISYTSGSYTLNYILFKKLISQAGGALFLYNDVATFLVSNCFFYMCNSTGVYSNPKRSTASGGGVYTFGKSLFSNNCFLNCNSFSGYGGGCYFGTNSNNQINQNRNSYSKCSSVQGGSFLSDFGYQQLYNINSSFSISTSINSVGGSTMFPSSSISEYIQIYIANGVSSWNIESQSGTTSNFRYSNVINISTSYIFSVYQSNSIASYSNFQNVKSVVFKIYSGSGSMNNCFSNTNLNIPGYILTSNFNFYNILNPTIICMTPYNTEILFLNKKMTGIFYLIFTCLYI